MGTALKNVMASSVRVTAPRAFGDTGTALKNAMASSRPLVSSEFAAHGASMSVLSWLSNSPMSIRVFTTALMFGFLGGEPFFSSTCGFALKASITSSMMSRSSGRTNLHFPLVCRPVLLAVSFFGQARERRAAHCLEVLAVRGILDRLLLLFGWDGGVLHH